jgi:solute carrier family 8 (sodium/calcium exchanger)
MTVGGDTDDDGNEIPPSWTDYLLHFLTFFWKLVGACVPPT